MQRQWKLYLLGLTFVLLAALALMPSSRVKADDDHHGNVVGTQRLDGSPSFITIDVPGAIFTGGRKVTPGLESFVGKYIDKARHTHGFSLDLLSGSFATIDVPDSLLTGAEGINPAGDIVGVYVSADHQFHGFMLADGNYTTIDVPSATITFAFGINARGDIVGSFCDLSFGSCPFISGVPVNNRGFLLSQGQFTLIDFPGAVLTQALEINPRGDIVGFYQDAANVLHGFLLTSDGFSTIDYPGAAHTGATGINPRGDIVGTYCPAACDPIRSFGRQGFLLRDGQFTALSFPGAEFMSVYSITPGGDISGSYRDFSGGSHGFIIRHGDD